MENVTGKGSPAGARFFVSKNPGLVLEIIAERYPDEHGNRKPFIRISFKSETKSELHAGRGYLGTGNTLGTDTNANRHYGLFKVMDPGAGPYKDDGDDVDEEWSRTAEQKAEDRVIIDKIRKTGWYRSTPQDNQYRISSKLVELNWDPAEMRVYARSLVIPGMGKPMGRPPLVDGAPSEDRTAPGEASAPQMGRLKRRLAVP